MNKRKQEVLISSRETELINKRFLIKASVHKSVILIIVQDIVEDHFKIQYFTDHDMASNFIKLLKKI